MLVDDEVHVLEGLSLMIDWASMGVTDIMTAKNGEEAWERFCTDPPDLLITDMYMPKMNGVELIRRVRRSDPDLPVIILSGYGDFAYTREAIHHNVARYILKPSEPDEIEREIRETLEEMAQKRNRKRVLEEIRETMERNLPILREQFVYELVTGSLPEREITEEKLAFYRVDPAILQSAAVLMLKLYKADDRRPSSEYEWQLFKYAASNIAEEIVAEEGGGCLLRHMGDRLPLVMYADGEEELMRRAERTAHRIIRALNDYLDLDANVGVGAAAVGPGRLPLSFRSSDDALEYAEAEGVNLVIRSDEVCEAARWPSVPAERIRRLAEAIRDGDAENGGELWNEIERAVAGAANGSLAYVQAVCVSVASEVTLRLLESDDAFFGEGELAGMLQQVYGHRTVRKLLEWMRQTLSGLLEQVRAKHEAAAEAPYVQLVKKYVEKHYKEKISFAQLAAELNISRNYLSNLFTKETGVNFLTYLTRFRIRKAAELLAKKQYMVYEVAEKVGYPDPAHFSKMFKQVTGMSPLEYMVNGAREEP